MNSLIAKYRNWRNYRRTYTELMDLTDRQLADIALSRGSIRELLRQTAAKGNSF